MIILENISKTFAGKDVSTEVLKNINMEISEGDFAVITGKSGCGKTTLLNLIGLMEQPTSGKYIFRQADISNLKENEAARWRNKQIGFVFQSFNLINEFNALENVCVPMGYAGISKSLRTKTAKDLLEKVGMSHRINHYPTQLSGGEQQRVAIARALSNNPGLILADEPTGNLDEKNSFEVIKIFSELNKIGITIVMVTHDMSMHDFASRTIKLQDGRIL